MYRAAAAVPFDDPDRVTAGLRGQLRVMAAAAGADPDWSTLRVQGPVRSGAHRGARLSEWTATVVVTGASPALDDRWIDALRPTVPRSIGAAAETTSPLVEH